MKGKTCGQCRHCKDSKSMGMCEQQKLCLCPEELPACSKFEPKIITKGDRIRQMSDEELAEMSVYEHKYYSKEGREYIWFRSIFVGHVDYAEREDAVMIALMKLNAPADCVKQNGYHDTQADLCKADNTESEVEDE